MSLKQPSGDVKKSNAPANSHMDLEDLIGDLLEALSKVRSNAPKISMEVSCVDSSNKFYKSFVSIGANVDHKQDN